VREWWSGTHPSTIPQNTLAQCRNVHPVVFYQLTHLFPIRVPPAVRTPCEDRECTETVRIPILLLTLTHRTKCSHHATSAAAATLNFSFSVPVFFARKNIPGQPCPALSSTSATRGLSTTTRALLQTKETPKGRDPTQQLPLPLPHPAQPPFSRTIA